MIKETKLQNELDETSGNNVGWTYSLACSPEEECKTLCSLLVLWMIRTNQEDVSAFQFHLLGMNHMHKDFT